MSLFDYVETAFADVLAIERKMRAIEHDLADPAHRPRQAARKVRATAARLRARRRLHAARRGRARADRRRASKKARVGAADRGVQRRPAEPGHARARAADQVDLLLLDEPTNHLDLDGIEFLEEFLQASRAATSSSRTTGRSSTAPSAKIVELAHGKLIEYPGNYEKFVRAARRADGEDGRRLRAPAGAHREDAGVHPPQHRRAEDEAGQVAPQDAGAARRGGAAGDGRDARELQPRRRAALRRDGDDGRSA